MSFTVTRLIPVFSRPTPRLLIVASAAASLAGCHASAPRIPADPPAAAPVSGAASGSTGLAYDVPHMPMAQRLALIAQDANPDDLLFLNRQRADNLRKQLAGETDPRILRDLLPKYAEELVYAGECDEGIHQLDRLEKLLRGQPTSAWPRTPRELDMLRAVAYMRMGEQQNCMLNHNSESCLAPIRGGGIHKLQRGSRGAVAVLTRMLGHNGSDLSARWLLNIAYMTLGEYPMKVPRKWLVPPETFKSDYDPGRFRDIAGDLGLDTYGLSGGVIVDDFDNDGNLDIVTSSLGLNDPLHYFHNNGDGTFTDRTKEAGLSQELGGLNIIQTDYNNDGYPDILVLRGGWFQGQGRHPMSLLRNNRDGTFTDVTEEAGLLHFRPTQTAVWLDYNNDGWLDLFVGNESRGMDVNPCELFRNNGDGTFTEVGKEAGVAYLGYVKGVTSADYDNDGRPDLFLSVQGGQNVLFHNDGPRGADHSPKAPWKFTNVAKQAGVTEPIFSFPCFFFDYDNDGWPDLFIVGYVFQKAEVGLVAADYLGMHPRGGLQLFHNDHNGHFTDVTRAVHLDKIVFGMGLNYGDIDNDGWLDMYVGTGTPDLSFITPNRMFRNAEGKYFQDVTTAAGVGHLQKGHGVAFADLNNDGQQDIYEVMGGALSGDTAHSVLYENPGHPGNHWVTLKLEGVRTNRAAVGARIRVVANTPSGQRSIYRTVSSGGSFGANPFRQEIGLGKATGIDRVEVFWPVTGQTQVVRGLQMDRFYKLREGDPAATPWAVRSFAFARRTASRR